MGEGGVDKRCSVCGLDVSAKKRVKDAAGRYLCEDCFAKAKAARGAQTAPPPEKGGPAGKGGGASKDDDNAFLLSLGGKQSVAEKGMTPCPECGRPMIDGTVVCVGCGFNTKTNKRTHVKVVKVKPEPGEKAASGGGGLADKPHLVGIGAILFFGAFAGAGFAVPEVGMIYPLVSSVFSLIVTVWLVITAWQEEWWQGLLCLLCGLYALYWAFVKCENALLKWLYGAAIIASILGIVVNPEIMKLMQGG